MKKKKEKKNEIWDEQAMMDREINDQISKMEQRQVGRSMKIIVSDFPSKSRKQSKILTTILSWWDPPQEIVESLKEGDRITLMSVSPSKWQRPGETVEISASKFTRWTIIPKSETIPVSIPFTPRAFIPGFSSLDERKKKQVMDQAEMMLITPNPINMLNSLAGIDFIGMIVAAGPKTVKLENQIELPYPGAVVPNLSLIPKRQTKVLFVSDDQNRQIIVEINRLEDDFPPQNALNVKSIIVVKNAKYDYWFSATGCHVVQVDEQSTITSESRGALTQALKAWGETEACAEAIAKSKQQLSEKLKMEQEPEPEKSVPQRQAVAVKVSPVPMANQMKNVATQMKTPAKPIKVQQKKLAMPMK